jgi:hypothetical protein
MFMVSFQYWLNIGRGRERTEIAENDCW